MTRLASSEGEVSSDQPPSLCGVEDDQPPLQTLPTPRGSLGRINSSRWGDWRWQMGHRLRTFDQLLEYFPNLCENTHLPQVIAKYPMAITPYYASLIHRADLSDPVYQMCVPQVSELCDPSFLSADPLEEGEDMPVPGLVHRYTDRALLIATTTCSMYCRHCTRKRVAGMRESTISPRRLSQVVAYLNAHPEISDVIVSGGDPLTMGTEAIETILAELRRVRSVQIIRIGTRTPVVLPQRITDELTAMLRQYHPIWINTHFNHPNELTPEAAEACGRLADAGIPLGNQSVLLRGVNDQPQVIEQLCRGLVRMRVRPYYLYQCDLVRGVEHFRTPLSRGIEIMEYLRGRCSGIAIPNFVVDAPHGGGKIPLLPSYIVSTSPTHTVIRNFEGMLIAYPEPAAQDTPMPTAAPSNAAGVWELASGQASAIFPSRSNRQLRRSQRQCTLWSDLGEPL
jgi:lysine 2,3-aminomutase